jgi:hypothetical protein
MASVASIGDDLVRAARKSAAPHRRGALAGRTRLDENDPAGSQRQRQLQVISSCS